MSSISPISVRIASKTRFFETTGDSSYYYSSQLLNNMALLKAVTKLGQQLGWPSKVLDTQKPKAKQGSSFLAKASQSAANSRMEPLINLRATPGKEWISANSKLVEKLITSQQFFNSKAIGFLAKGLGRSGKFSTNYLTSPNEKAKTEKQSYPSGSAKTKGLLTFDPFVRSKSAHSSRTTARGSSKSAHLHSQSAARGEDSWFTSFYYLAQLAKYCNSRYYKQPLNRHRAYAAVYESSATFVRSSKSARIELQTAARGAGFTKVKEKVGFSTKKKGFTNNPLRGPQTSQKKSITNLLRKESKQAFKTPVGLSFYLTALGLVGHSQILRTSLVIAPIISGSLQSNLLLADHREIIKTASSNGIGLVSTSPKCYISRSSKDTVLNFFFKIPAKLAEKRANNRPQYQQVYILADLQGLRKPQKRLKPAYASVRWL